MFFTIVFSGKCALRAERELQKVRNKMKTNEESCCSSLFQFQDYRGGHEYTRFLEDVVEVNVRVRDRDRGLLISGYISMLIRM